MRAFQREKRLFVDGVVGENTWREIWEAGRLATSRPRPLAAWTSRFPTRSATCAPRSASCATGSAPSTGAGSSPTAIPEEFVAALTEAGWLAALIPEEYGGGGLGLATASAILEEVNASGGNAAACHAQMYVMGTLLRHGSEEQKRRTCRGSRPASFASRPSA